MSDDTCWRIPRRRDKTTPPNLTRPTPRGRETIEFLTRAGLVPLGSGRPLGHVCTAKEGEIKAQHPPSEMIYLCPQTPYLRVENQMLMINGDRYCSPP